MRGAAGGHVTFYGVPGYDEVNGELFFAAAFERDGLRGNEVTIEQSEYTGRTVTIWLDPEGELTSPRLLVDNREEMVEIP